MSELALFDLNEDMKKRIMDAGRIPVDFFNKQGQVIIYKKEGAGVHEIEKLFKVSERGIYYRESDLRAFTGEIKEPPPPEGFSNTKLFTEQMTQDFGNDVSNIFDDLKNTSFSSLHTRMSRNRVNGVFEEFQSNPDVMAGMLNVLSLLKDMNFDADVKTALKRAIVSMSIKTRGMIGAGKGRSIQLKQVSNLMMTALFSHIGKLKMSLPQKHGLTPKERQYISQYPFISYLMLAHEPGLDTEIKFNILRHRRPSEDLTNIYPDKKWLLLRLRSLAEKYREQNKLDLASDMVTQIKLLLKPESLNDDDPAILSLATEFASLTNDTQWRDAFPPVEAQKIMLNESLYSYHARNMREFLDYVAISLAHNEKLIREGMTVIMKVNSADERKAAGYEVGQVIMENRFQSKPIIKRLGSIQAKAKSRADGKVIPEFIPESFKKDRRGANYDLFQDHTREIIFIPDDKSTPELLQVLTE